MSKLDEIEARINNELHPNPDRENIVRAKVASMKDLRLLVRAVRQLGRETMAWYSSRPDLATERIDPDVLELLEEA